MRDRIKDSIPYVSLFIAIITAGALVWNGYEAREHYRKIVRPMVIPYVTSSLMDGRPGIFLRNEGLGSAKIKYKRVVLDGDTASMKDVLLKMVGEEIVSQRGGGFVMDLGAGGSYLGKGGEKEILVLDSDSVLKIKEFDTFIHDRVNIYYQWCSTYGECYDSCTAKNVCPESGP